ncbi:MAG TPA: cellulase family glycosylhydrolase [Acidimicrobiales bacterium]|nr:cellulase family glycosylhydrolase [Acidimicrobiales bacterium]
MGTRMRRMVLAIIAMLPVLVAGSFAWPASATAGQAPESQRAFDPALPIGHMGRWLTDASGRVVLLHGVNLVSKTDGQTPRARGFGAADAAFLAANGFDVVRLGLTAGSIMPQPGVIDADYLDSFARTVETLTDHGLLVLVDLHQDGWGPTLGSDGFPGWMTLTDGAINTHTGFPLYYVTNPAIQAAFDSFWHNAPGPGGVGLQMRVAAMFAALARRVGSNPGVLGYDLINEPFPGSTWQPCISAVGCATLDHSELDPYYAKVSAAIRAHDPSHLVFGEPFVLFNFGVAGTNIDRPGRRSTGGLSWHLYTTDPALDPSAINYAEQWSTATGGALINTEFGATTDVSAIDRQVGELDNALMPWIWWSFDGLMVKDVASAPTGANLDTPVVDALVRPHPVAVAGTPTALHYDVPTATLTFRYSTRKPGGGSYSCHAVTSLQVPTRSYPAGYHVLVTGGVVTSEAGSPHLTVVADPGALSVSVVIGPGGTTRPGKPVEC